MYLVNKVHLKNLIIDKFYQQHIDIYINKKAGN